MTERKGRRAVIIGGGIAGPVLAMWLQRVGIEATIFEQRGSSAGAEGAFLGVAPNGMNVLDGLGLAGKVAEAGVSCSRFEFRNAEDRAIGAIDRSEDARRFGWGLTMVRRGTLHSLLLEEARRRGVDVQLGKRLAEIDRSNPAEVVARFEDGREARGDLLIGCDGLRSTVRARVLPDSPAPVFSGLWDVGGFAPGVKVPLRPGENVMVFGRRAFFGAFLTPGGEVWWFHNGPAGTGGETAPERVRARLLALHEEDAPWISDLLGATPSVLGPWGLYDLDGLERWSEGRVCVIGDAAHAMSPSAGQGASLAMEDAMLLAMSLRDVDEPSRAFEVFERLRRPRVEAIAKQARRNGSGKAMESRVALWLRDLMLPAFLRLGGAAQNRSYAFRTDWEQRVG